ncbi:osteopontin isoform X2 [Alosa alosa]|uniref:osteopontin isoform X2 n=1 Tax=Alosa alosa TaxID=278164 RepID=UPI0020153EE8|nr:osteopontin isoform X2 [Alosa alosa]
MKAVIVFVLLFASVFCHPVKRSASSSESSEEVVRPAPVLRKAPVTLTMKAAEPAAAPADSDESTETSEETEESNTASDDSTDSTDSADSADSVDTQESETEESISESTESGEAPTTAATTAFPISVVVPTFPPFTDSGRGDSMGYSDYKKSGYMESNVVEKEPSPYKSYADDKMGLNMVSKKSGATFDDGANNVEKTLKVYKALQVHEEILEEDTSTPDVESQSLDTSSGIQDEAVVPKQAEAGLDSSASAAEGPASSQSESDSQSQRPRGRTRASADSDGTSESESASASQEEESESSQSSEESAATATPGAADSDESDESNESQSDSTSEELGPEPTSEAPTIVITAK